MTKLVAIVGPTASGKTALSIELAKRLGCEIIGCDSMQIYREMNIGTAKPTSKETCGIPHHVIDFLPPDKNFSAEAYKELAAAAISDISSRKKIPLVVGGTGLYLDTLLRSSNAQVPPASAEYREKILSCIKCEEDITALWEKLYECDAPSAEKIHKNNVKRVIRALEIYDVTGKPKSYWDELSKVGAGEYDAKVFVLDFHNREALYSRIDKRVDVMMEMGLLSEVSALLKKGYLRGEDTASSAIGYKELVRYVLGEVSLSEAVNEIKLCSRRYAKRQLTWFRHESGAKTVYMDDEAGAMRDISEPLSEILGELYGFLGK